MNCRAAEPRSNRRQLYAGQFVNSYAYCAFCLFRPIGDGKQGRDTMSSSVQETVIFLVLLDGQREQGVGSRCWTWQGSFIVSGSFHRHPFVDAFVHSQ